MTTQNQIDDIKKKVGTLSGDSKREYLSGLRDGMDLSELIADDAKWNLAGDATFQSFLDYLDTRN